ncbi:MAG TPA: preprotein translocase subunit SecY [Candidatus Ruminococcus avistercoris]|nr:preprotein translocase subunit SecY [Candidatus Ruminococcus avistercoris]
MFKTLQNAFKIKDVRRRIFYVFLMLVVVRLGTQIPVPGVNGDYFKEWFASQTGDAFNFLDAFTGGSFSSFSIFALNITPYITSSIIVQLLTIAIPKLEELHKDGETGRKKIVAITRYLTVGLALFESAAMAIGFGNRGLIPDINFGKIVVVVATLTAGSAFLMWVGERINEKGIGNGISIVLMINIVSRIPSDMVNLYESFVKPSVSGSLAKSCLAAVIILAIILAVIVLVLILNGAQRNIPVQYSKKMVGRRMVGGQSSHIPLKVNTAGVIPIIFASSIMSFPGIIATFIGKTGGTGWGAQIMAGLNSSNWFSPSQPLYSLGLVLYIVLVIFFAYFYTSITFNPLEVADNIKKQGGFIPGIRPGKPTVDYLNNILSYVIFIGAAGLTIVAVIPFFFNGVFGANVSFGGTSLIIVVSVILETLKQIESMMLVRNYKGFLNE